MLKAALIISVFLGSTDQSLIKTTNNACTKLYDYPIKYFSKNCYDNPNVGATVPEMISQNNFTYEEYNVTTNDGYILTLFRIPPKPDDLRKKKQPVYLQHGIGTDSACWVHIGNMSLAFRLAALGFDVWLGNERGTVYSLGNTMYNSSQSEYWNFNLDKVAEFDIPASLEKVSEVTGLNQSTIYIGHSKGSTLMFMLASQSPSIAAKFVKGFVAFSPVAYLDLPVALKVAASFSPILEKISDFFKSYALFSNSDQLHKFATEFCSLAPYVCRFNLNNLFGTTNQFSPDDLLVLYGQFPQTFSVPELIQYAQIYNSQKFRKYDYGKTKNLEKYGQAQPPYYNLSNITLPTFLYYGKHDSLATEATSTRTFQEVGSTVKGLKSVPTIAASSDYDYNHIDFVFSHQSEENLYANFYQILDSLSL